jgi:hypothetical protein
MADMHPFAAWMILITLIIEQLLVNIWMCVRARVSCFAHRFFACRAGVCAARARFRWTDRRSAVFQVLCQGCELLRGAAAHPQPVLPGGGRLQRRAGDVRRSHLRRAAGHVCNRAAAALLPGRPRGGVHLPRLPGRRQPARQLHRGAHRARGCVPHWRPGCFAVHWAPLTPDAPRRACHPLPVAIPVTIFLSNCFEMANDSECPEVRRRRHGMCAFIACVLCCCCARTTSARLTHACPRLRRVAPLSRLPAQSWLAYGGITRLVCGMSAHRRWHYTGPAGQPSRFVRWYARSVDAPKMETLTNMWHSLVAWLTRTKPPWTLEAEAAEAEAAEAAGAEHAAADADAVERHSARSSISAHSLSSSVASATRLKHAKRRLAAMGLGGVYVVWCVSRPGFGRLIRINAARAAAQPAAHADHAASQHSGPSSRGSSSLVRARAACRLCCSCCAPLQT